MAPPPPPPLCFPFTSSKPKRRLSWSSENRSLPLPPAPQEKAVRHPSFSPTSTLTSRPASITFHSDSEKYDELPSTLPVIPKGDKGRPKLGRSNTMTGTKKSTASSKWGYGWGMGIGRKDKQREIEPEIDEKSGSQVNLLLPTQANVQRRDTRSTQASRSTQRTQETHRTQASQQSRGSGLTRGDTQRTTSSRSTAPKPRPPLMGHELYPQDSTATLVGSAFERKINDNESIRIKPDTTDRLDEMRRLMGKDNLDF